MSGLKSGLAWVAVGRFTEIVCCLCMVRLTIMNEARRKNMMSIKGMISSLALLCGSGETIFIAMNGRWPWRLSAARDMLGLSGKALLFGVVDHDFDVRSRGLQLELELRHERVEIVEWNQGDDGNAQTAGRGNERFPNAPRYARHSQFCGADGSKRAHDARDGAQQPKQWREGDECVQRRKKAPGLLQFQTSGHLQRPLERGMVMIEPMINHPDQRIL